MANCFEYGEKETGYLKSRDARLAGVIDKIGHIERVNTRRISRERNDVLVKNTSSDHGSFYSWLAYRHRKIDKKLFEKYRRRFSPYCSVASLYLWAVAGGAIPELKDPASKKTNKRQTAVQKARMGNNA